MFKHNRIATPKTIPILIALLLFVAVLPVAAQSPNDEQPVEPVTHWQYRWGDSPTDESGTKTWLLDAPDDPNWTLFDNAERLNNIQQFRLLWMRTQLPDGNWRDPSIFLDSVDQGLEAYLDDTLIYSAGQVDRTGNEPALGTTHHLIPLPLDFQGKTLNLRFYSQYNTIGPRAGIFIGSRTDHILNILYVDIDRFILANLLFVISFGALIFYLSRREQKAFLALAVFTASSGIFIIFRTQLVELFTTNIFLQEFAKIGAIFLLPVGLAAFFEQVVGPGPHKIIRRLWQIHLVYAVAALSLSLFGVVQLLNTVWPYEILAVVTLLTVVIISAREAIRGNPDARLFTLGYSLVLFFAMLEMFDDLGVVDLSRRVVHWGIFGFVLVLLIIMARRFRQAIEARAQLDTIRQELNLARNIQQNLLPPKHPDWTALDVACDSIPAHEMGGDLYAYHAFDNDRFALMVGDVSGKGMPAALLMGVSLSSLREHLEKELSPSKLLSYLDYVIAPYTHATRQNCALCCVTITIPPAQQDNCLLRAANAGCMSPVIKRANGCIEWMDVGGIPLGVGHEEKSEYTEVTTLLSKRDIVVLTSDGVVEAQNGSRELFGFERLEDAIIKGPTDSAVDMLNHIQAQVAKFVGHTETHDDMTIVVVKI